MTSPGVSADRFLHLDGYNGWGFADRAHEVEPDHVPGIVVTPEGLALPRGPLPAASTVARPIGNVRARGLAFDRLGRAYAVSDDRRGLCLIAGEGRAASDCWQLEPGAARRFGGLAIDARNRLYVALPAEGEVRMLRVDPAGELARVRMVRPVAVAIDAQQRLIVLDTGQGTPGVSDLGVNVVRVARLGDAIAASPTGAIAVVRRDHTSIELGQADGSGFRSVDLGRPLLPALAFAKHTDPDGAELVYVGDRLTGRVILWRIDAAGATPLRWSTRGGAFAALAFRGDDLFALGPDCGLIAIELEDAGFYERSRSVVLGPLDSRVNGTEWHRVTAALAATPTASVGVAVEILADDDCDAYDPALSAPDTRWESARELVCPRPGRPAELAFRAARGRYAYLRLTFHGDGRSTPLMHWLRVEFPRNSYLRYLPAVYSEEPTSRNLSARFLSLFEAANVDLGREITSLRRLFEPYAGEPEFFRWLAERLDVLLEPDWPEERTRRALADAFWLYRRRGTRAALERLLLDHGGPQITIVEGHRQRSAFFLGSAALGCGSVLPGGCAPARMQLDRGVRLGAARLDSRPFVEADPIVERRGELSIFLPPAIASQPELVRRVTRIANLEAPAGAEVRIVQVAAGLVLGSNGRLGIDAALGARTPWRLSGEGEDAPAGTHWAGGMLLGREPGIGGDLALGRGPRLGMDSRL